MLKAILTAAALAAAAAGCTTGPSASPGGGTVIGSQAGAGAGQPPIGAVEGGLLGEDFGRSLSDAERRAAVQAEYEALEYGRAGQPTRWRTAGGTRGEITVGASYEVNRLDCREYRHTATIDGRPRMARGTACREPGGNWRIVG